MSLCRDGLVGRGVAQYVQSMVAKIESLMGPRALHRHILVPCKIYCVSLHLMLQDAGAPIDLGPPPEFGTGSRRAWCKESLSCRGGHRAMDQGKGRSKQRHTCLLLPFGWQQPNLEQTIVAVQTNGTSPGTAVCTSTLDRPE